MDASIFIQMQEYIRDFFFIGNGLKLTVILSITSFSLAFLVAIILTFFRHMYPNTWIDQLIISFVSLIRGIPFLLQLTLIYFLIPQIINVSFERLGIVTAIVTIVINTSTRMSEVLRSGVQSVSIGQFEASKALRIPIYYTWKDVILPQVIRNTTPSLINEVIHLMKETSLVSMFGVADISRCSAIISSQKFMYLVPSLLAGVYYYCLTMLIIHIGNKIERALKYD